VASYRRLPSGKWQAAVFHPSGKRVTKTGKLKREVEIWAAEQEAQIHRGEWVDPKAGQVTVADWHAQWLAARSVEPATAAKNESHWRVHVAPRWGSWPLASIQQIDVAGWVKAMGKAGVGAHTVQAVVHYFSAMLGAAVINGKIRVSPCHNLALPRTDARPPVYYTLAEAELLWADLGEYRLMVELDFWTGLRLGELFALTPANVLWLRRELVVAQVVTRFGVRAYPKSAKSNRTVPIPEHLMEPLSAQAAGRGPEDRLWPAPDGGPIDEHHHRKIVWTPAVRRAGTCAKHRPDTPVRVRALTAATVARCEACAPIPWHPPNVGRHTAASWLVMAGVDLMRVQAILGHEKITTTQRYAHLAPDHQEAVRVAWRGMLAGDHARSAHGPQDKAEPPSAISGKRGL
jgi:integrase